MPKPDPHLIVKDAEVSELIDQAAAQIEEWATVMQDVSQRLRTREDDQ